MATVGWDVSCMQLTRPFPTHPASKRHVHFISTCVGCGLRLPLIGGSYSLCLSLSEWALGFACAQLSWTFLPGPMSRCSTCGTHHEQTTKSRSRWSIFFLFSSASFRTTYVGCNAQEAPLRCTSANSPRATSGCPSNLYGGYLEILRFS